LGRNPLIGQVAQLQKEKLQKRLKQAEAIVEFQKKACALLAVPTAQELKKRGPTVRTTGNCAWPMRSRTERSLRPISSRSSSRRKNSE
jgi:hypothetical protein